MSHWVRCSEIPYPGNGSPVYVTIQNKISGYRMVRELYYSRALSGWYIDFDFETRFDYDNWDLIAWQTDITPYSGVA